MQFIRNLYNLPEHHAGCVATIGNFDGVHLGHQLIIRQLKSAAKQHRLPSVVICFEPYPQEYFSPVCAPARLMRLREKIQYFETLAVEQLLCLRFDEKLASQLPEVFVRQTLVESLQIKHFIVGKDFRFGYQRQGSIDTLISLSGDYGFTVECADTCIKSGERVSSSRIRNLLLEGNIRDANELLGRPYKISGRVVRGDKRGRELGFPTININLHRLRSPVNGIFASRVHGINGQPLPAVSSIGSRPVFAGEEVNLETHILDFDKNLYGKYVSVELCEYIREEKDFPDSEALKKQMTKDIAIARRFFAN